MDKIARIRQEIERLYDGEAPKHDQQCDFDDGYFTGIGAIYQFLDALSEEPDKSLINQEGLEKEIKRYLQEEHDRDTTVKDVARHFAEWGADHLRDSTKMVDKSLEEARREYDTQKYTPSPSVGIEDVARVQFASHAKVFDKKRKAVFDWEQFKEVAGIFYGFGKKVSPETKEKEQPDKDLEEAAEEWCKVNHKGIALSADKKSHYLAEGVDAFKAGTEWQKKRDEEAIKTAEDHAFLAGADWQKEQFEKNRLAHCDKLTKEEYDLETDFATEIIEKQHRQPTFTDAINYGMRAVKEYLMKEAVEGFFTKSIDGDVVFAESTALDVDPKSVKVGDKVKLIVIKED